MSIVGLSAATAACADVEEDKMYSRMLGNAGLKVSVLSYGFWATFGWKKSDLQKDQQGGSRVGV